MEITLDYFITIKLDKDEVSRIIEEIDALKEQRGVFLEVFLKRLCEASPSHLSQG